MDFCLPIIFVFYNPALIVLACSSFYFAVASNVEISIIWIIMLMILSYFTSISMPSVNGGILAILSLLFISLGINEVYLGIATTLLMILDYPCLAMRASLTFLQVAKNVPNMSINKNVN